jgi:hypothetical protein
VFHNVEKIGRSLKCRIALKNNSWKVAGAVDLVCPVTVTSREGRPFQNDQFGKLQI